MIRLVQPDSPASWAVARRLVEAYAASLDIDLGFQDFQHEITSLQRAYGPPDGAFLVAEQDGRGIGCVALRQFAQDTCEMKRLYVSPDGRGQGVGRALAEGIISEARRLGYARMLLDTLPSMREAHRLYAALGFTPIPAYRYNPVPGTTFMELRLR
jgi:GNAT superfamily N-acetyltransferase